MGGGDCVQNSQFLFHYFCLYSCEITVVFCDTVLVCGRRKLVVIFSEVVMPCFALHSYVFVLLETLDRTCFIGGEASKTNAVQF